MISKPEGTKIVAVFRREQYSNHKIASVAVIVLYITITFAIDLFHHKDCHHTDVEGTAKNIISCSDQCIACVFLAGSNSTEASCSSALFSFENQIVSQFLLNSTVVNHDDWAYSIISRAPPFTISS